MVRKVFELSTPELVRRAEATRNTLARYRRKPFDWSERATCIHMARYHLRQMGHRPPPIPDFRSALGARQALGKAGFDSVTALLDSLLPRIAPAAMLVGDLAVLEGIEGLDSVVINAGGKVLGWHEAADDGVKPLIAREIKAAWRV